MPRADRHRKNAQLDYADAMIELEKTRPDLEQSIRRYVTALNAEAAQRRAEAAEARELLEGRTGRRQVAGPPPERDPFRLPGMRS